ncbi:histidine kinase [Prosthecomicrobium sp. N25]
MPSLLKFLAVVGILAGLGFAGVYILANYVEPKPRDITIRIPSERFREP